LRLSGVERPVDRRIPREHRGTQAPPRRELGLPPAARPLRPARFREDQLPPLSRTPRGGGAGSPLRARPASLPAGRAPQPPDTVEPDGGRPPHGLGHSRDPTARTALRLRGYPRSIGSAATGHRAKHGAARGRPREGLRPLPNLGARCPGPSPWVGPQRSHGKPSSASLSPVPPPILAERPRTAA